MNENTMTFAVTYTRSLPGQGKAIACGACGGILDGQPPRPLCVAVWRVGRMMISCDECAQRHAPALFAILEKVSRVDRNQLTIGGTSRLLSRADYIEAVQPDEPMPEVEPLEPAEPLPDRLPPGAIVVPVCTLNSDNDDDDENDDD